MLQSIVFTCPSVSGYPYWQASNNPNYFSPVEFSSRTSQEESVHSKLPNFSQEIQQHIVKVHWSSSVFEEKIWSSDIILLALSWFTNWPTLISFWNLFLSAKWTELATAFLSIQYNAWNICWGLAAHLSSQHFSPACKYFQAVIGISLSSLKWFFSCGIVFRKCKCFPVRFWSKRNKDLILSRCYINNSCRWYVWFINIIHDSWKRWRRLIKFSFLKLIIITISLITVTRPSHKKSSTLHYMTLIKWFEFFSSLLALKDITL